MGSAEYDNNVKGVEYAKKLAEQEHGLTSDQTGISRELTFIVAVAWSLFQLSVASWLLLDTLYTRSIHLAFGIALIYMNIPMFKFTPNWRPDLRWMLAMHRVTILDYVLAILAAMASLYLVIDYDGIAVRYGAPVTRDLIMGLLLVVLLLEATRRVIGPALPVIAMVFCAYAFLGPYMPDIIAFKGVSLNRFVGQMAMSSEGIYGIPLDVSRPPLSSFSSCSGAMLDKAGAGQPIFIKPGLEHAGRLQRRTGQGGRFGQRA